jgi:uncharacterized membrane protein YqjE
MLEGRGTVRLTKYQIVFVNFVFIAFLVTSLGGLYSIAFQAYEYGDQLFALRGEAINQSIGEAVKWTMLLSRIFMVLGALGVMWLVRQSKADESPL